ncbi:amidohydrolase family protein [soil metagenome]
MSTEATVDGLALVDHHCHGVVAGDLDRGGFEGLMTESFDPAPAGTSHFDGPLGLAIRRWCAPLLDLPPHASPEAYVERRVELGARRVNQRLLRAAGLGALLVDGGHEPGRIVGVTEMGRLAGVAAHEVTRLEAVAEACAADGVRAADYADAFVERLEATAARAVGLKTILAYRGGFAIDTRPPSSEEVTAAAGRWLCQSDGRRPRVADPVLLRFGIWSGADLARRRGLPLQFHVGFGDPDITLHRTDPSLLTGLLRALARWDVDVVLLHCYPYHRQAAYLAAVLPNVYFDVGLALNHTGASAGSVLAEALELTPFTKHLYSSDAWGLAELHHLGALLFRRCLAGLLDGWVAGDLCTAGDAERIAWLIGAGNARRVYPLPARGG